MDIEKYLDSFFKGTKNPSLRAMKYFMEEFDHPEKDLKFLHIAGTNGKGSCAEMMTNVLMRAGYRVGKFMSPHLIKYNERISVQNKNISDEDMERLIKNIKPKIDKYNSSNSEKITLFELETTMAILYFNESDCDFVVLETGLGGMYDCTNIVNPVVSIITSIGYDHMDILGNTLAEIAEQKAGIIKENSDTIFVKQEENDVNDIIEKVCRQKNNKLHLVKREDISNYSYDNNFLKFDYKNYKDVWINLKGEKQVFNASVCIECVNVLRNKSYDISDNDLREGLKTVIHKGRFEKISSNPLIIFDGAHNIPAINNFVSSVDMYYKDWKRVYVISILNTKDYKAVLRKLLEDDGSVFIFTNGNDKSRYFDKSELLNFAKECTENDKLYAFDLGEAINVVKEQYKNCVTFCVGSFYVYGTVIEMLKGNKND